MVTQPVKNENYTVAQSHKKVPLSPLIPWANHFPSYFRIFLYCHSFEDQQITYGSHYHNSLIGHSTVRGSSRLKLKIDKFGKRLTPSNSIGLLTCHRELLAFINFAAPAHVSSNKRNTIGILWSHRWNCFQTLVGPDWLDLLKKPKREKQ